MGLLPASFSGVNKLGLRQEAGRKDEKRYNELAMEGKKWLLQRYSWKQLRGPLGYPLSIFWGISSRAWTIDGGDGKGGYKEVA